MDQRSNVLLIHFILSCSGIVVCTFSSPFRVTGKMVGTASHESVQAGTKLLDIPLNPENNMTAL